MSVVEQNIIGVLVRMEGSNSTSFHVGEGSRSVLLKLPKLDPDAKTCAYDGAEVTITIKYDDRRVIDLTHAKV